MHYAQLVIYTASYSNERTRSIQYKYYRGERSLYFWNIQTINPEENRRGKRTRSLKEKKWRISQ